MLARERQGNTKPLASFASWLLLGLKSSFFTTYPFSERLCGLDRLVALRDSVFTPMLPGVLTQVSPGIQNAD